MKGTGFIHAHQAVMPLDVSTEDGSELAFDAVFDHGGDLLDLS